MTKNNPLHLGLASISLRQCSVWHSSFVFKKTKQILFTLQTGYNNTTLWYFDTLIHVMINVYAELAQYSANINVNIIPKYTDDTV